VSLMWLYRLAFALLSIALFSGCGFQPLYSGRPGELVLADLSSIELSPLDGVIGVQLYNTLHDNLELHDQTQKVYGLTLKYDTTSYPMITAQGSQIGRYTMILNVGYTVISLVSGSLVAEGQTSAHASYNVVPDNVYATFVAEEEASLRAAKQIGNQLSNLLFLHLSRRNQHSPDAP